MMWSWGAIAEIVIACVIVVAAFVGLLIYSLVIRPKSGKVAGQESNKLFVQTWAVGCRWIHPIDRPSHFLNEQPLRIG
jgi:branched-subunit amino acid ABC-type transport system permease component